MKDVIRGLNENSDVVVVDTTLGAIYLEGTKQLKDVYGYDLYIIDFEDIPVKATKSYDDFITWLISFYSKILK